MMNSFKLFKTHLPQYNTSTTHPLSSLRLQIVFLIALSQLLPVHHKDLPVKRCVKFCCVVSRTIFMPTQKFIRPEVQIYGVAKMSFAWNLFLNCFFFLCAHYDDFNYVTKRAEIQEKRSPSLAQDSKIIFHAKDFAHAPIRWFPRNRTAHRFSFKLCPLTVWNKKGGPRIRLRAERPWKVYT